MPEPRVRIVGGGLAGSEAALQLAERGYRVLLHEMRPVRATPAHRGDGLAELVCSNTFKSERPDTSSGAFKSELEIMGCRLLPLARQARVPGGHALAVDRELFSQIVSSIVTEHPRIEVRREEVTSLETDEDLVLATGPLTSPDLSAALTEAIGAEGLFFYDAIAPSVLLESVDQDVVFRASRYDKGDADYLNCPLDREEYESFVDALLAGEQVDIPDFDRGAYFPGCMPIEVIASRGRESLRFGPMRPVGLRDPRTGRRPWAVVQLRQETRDADLYGLVGFQTQLRYGAQKEIFRRIPGLQAAEFPRLGSLHRNLFVDAPRHLAHDLSLRNRPRVWLAGQITGCEGYTESVASGLVAALAVDARARGVDFVPPPRETMLGSLLAYLRDPTNKRPQPMNVNFGLLPPLPERIRDKQQRKLAQSTRATRALENWWESRP
jgi:methylenetetrahydrofolate--tRNA-(uracil-5-)-methyltransferase